MMAGVRKAATDLQRTDLQRQWRSEMGSGQTAAKAPKGPGVPVAATVETIAATENKGRRENTPGMVRHFSAIDVIP